MRNSGYGRTTYCFLKLVGKNLSGFCCSGRLCAGAGVTCVWHSSSSWTCLSGGSMSRKPSLAQRCVLVLIGYKNYSLWFLHGFLCSTIACTDNFHLGFGCSKWAQALAGAIPVHLLFPRFRNGGSWRREDALGWQLLAPKVELHSHLSWAWSTSAWRSTNTSSQCNSGHLQLSFHWLHQGRKTTCSTEYMKSLQNLEVSIMKEESSWIWLFIPLLAPRYVKDTQEKKLN